MIYYKQQYVKFLLNKQLTVESRIIGTVYFKGERYETNLTKLTNQKINIDAIVKLFTVYKYLYYRDIKVSIERIVNNYNIEEFLHIICYLRKEVPLKYRYMMIKYIIENGNKIELNDLLSINYLTSSLRTKIESKLLMLNLVND